MEDLGVGELGCGRGMSVLGEGWLFAMKGDEERGLMGLVGK